MRLLEEGVSESITPRTNNKFTRDSRVTRSEKIKILGGGGGGEG